tara:strand:+ start:20 stop:1387 length:1368 start_codon:yes stop_codon:yes gene_type:complete
MRKKLITLIAFILIAACSGGEVAELETVSAESTTTSTTTPTTTTTTIQPKTIFALDEYGIELIEMKPQMKEQFDALIAFVEKRTGLTYTEYPRYELYTSNGYQEYNELSFLDNFEEDYEEGEWERAVLSENMWGLSNATPESMKNLLVEYQRCASSGSYNLVDKVLRVPVKKNQEKFNLWEQSVLVHELTHTLQGQIIDLAGWYDEMKEKDDFSDYAGRRSIMEAQADLVQARWESGLDQYDRTAMNSQQPNFTCRVQLPSYFYIPNELYYSFGPQLVKQINTQGGMEAINEALYLLPTAEQIYEPEKYFSGEIYEEVGIKDLIVTDYNLVKEGTVSALDIPYILQDTIGRVASVKAAIGLGGGAWKDYVNSSQQLMMSLKMTGDTPEDLEEIYNAYLAWANAQTRFTSVESFEGGILFIGDTNIWISSDGKYIRMLLTQNVEIFNEIISQINSF